MVTTAAAKIILCHLKASSQRVEQRPSCWCVACRQANHTSDEGMFRMKSHTFPVLIYLVRHLFPSMIIEKFTQDCLWLSVATRHPWNQFTRVQRLSCYMTLLLCNMVTNVMFWKVNSATTKRDEQARGEP